MSVLTNRPALRWLVPAAAAAVVIGGGAAVGTLSAVAEPSLPPRSAAQLLVDLQTARLDGLSGTVTQRADLGLPSLPGLGGQGSSELTSLISGRHTLRVWYAGPDQARIAVLGTLGETDVIRNGTDVWVWSSQQNEAVHQRLSPSDARSHALPARLPATPQEAAEQTLAAIDPTTEVTVGRSARVAGRDTYELVLAPRDKASLIGQVRFAIDAKEHVPLRFEIFPKGGGEAAFEVAFTQVDFARPDPQQFVFNPPKGAKVTEGSGRPDAARPGTAVSPQAAKPTVVGDGWTSVLVARLPERPASAQPSASKQRSGRDGADQFGAVLDQLPKVSGAWGSGRLLSGRLFSVLLTDDGRVLAGAVAPERLYEAARR